MRIPVFALALTAAVHAKEDSILVAPTEPLPAAEQAGKFLLPEGFKITLFASEPAINQPMNMGFDARGRLWVTTTVEYPYAAPGNRDGRDRIVILEDTTGDGHADAAITFADGLNIPAGILPDPDGRGCIAWSIPNIWRFDDTDEDGAADRRTKLYGPLGFENDVHGMSNSYRRGADGWLYTTHGFSNHSTFRGADGSEVSVHSGNTIRLRRDGSRVEQVTHGQVNPFGLFFDRLGYLYSADCHSRPVYNLIRGGYYPSFGKPHDGLGFAPPMISHSHGSTGIAGVAMLDDARWPDGFRDHLLIGNPVTGTLNHDTIDWSGASPTAIEQPEFLTSDDGWFRPVDLQLGPDGALYVADFYNSVIGHYEVPLDHPRRDRTRGRIWRIAPENLANSRPPDLTRLDVSGLAEALGDGNITVRNLAADLLEDRGASAEILRAVEEPAVARAAALHLLGRTGVLDPEIDLAPALTAGEPLVRVHALRVLAECKEWPAGFRGAAEAALADPDPHVRRAAAAALAARPSLSSIPALVAAGETTPRKDDHTAYTIRVALRNNLQQAGDFPAGLPRDPFLADVMPAVPSVGAARYLVDFLQATNAPLPGDAESRYLKHIVSQLPEIERVAVTLELIASRAGGDLGKRAHLLRQADEAARGAFRQPARALAEELLAAGDHPAAFEVVAGFRLAELRGEVLALAASEDVSRAVRLHAARVLAGFTSEDAADAWIKTPALAGLLRTSASDEQRTIARELAASAPGAGIVVELVAGGVLPPVLLQDPEVAKKIGEVGAKAVKSKAGELTAGLMPRPEALTARIRSLSDAHPAVAKHSNETLGRELFMTHCAVCHRLDAANATAGVLGPALDGVGARGPERLMEDILDPNRQVDPAFQMETITLKDGSVMSGIVQAEDPASKTLLLASPTGGEPTPVAIDQIEARQATGVSLMPATMAELLSDDQIHALVRYLRNAR